MSDSATPADFGRVEDDGTVYVRTPEGERSVGQVPDVDPSEAMAFFVRRFEALETEVSLLESRLAAGSLSADEARKAINSSRSNIVGANAVGDLEGLVARLDALSPQVEALEEARKAQKAEQHEQTRQAKEAMVAEAEKLSNGNDWRGGVQRFRDLLEQWKALPRIDRATDDELWHRFSSARTAYTRRRKQHLTKDNEQREAAKKAKQDIIERARPLAESTDWGETAREFRDLMAEWKAAGSAKRDVDDKLWKEFRGLQDTFFNARNAAFDEQDEEYRGNQEAKEKLLAEAEATLIPVTDPKAGREAFREFLNKYNEYGKVPRDAIRPLDNRVRALEDAVKASEEAEWRRTDPEARQRAADTVDMFTKQIEKLKKQAEEAGKSDDKRSQKKAKELNESIETYEQWLAQAQKTLAEFEA